MIKPPKRCESDPPKKADRDKTGYGPQNGTERRLATRGLPKRMSLRRGYYGIIPHTEMIKYAAISTS